MERIIIGQNQSDPLFVFENPQIRNCHCILSSSLSGDQLAIDEFRPVVYSAAYIRVKFVPYGSTGLRTADGKTFNVYPGEGFLDKLPYGTPVWYYSNDVLIGKFYSSHVTRSQKLYFDIVAVSAVGIMDGQQHLGNVYTGQTFSAVVSEIIGGAYPFTCENDVANLLIYGWLPIDTKRNNLHQLLFATGVMLDKDANGELYFRYPNINTQKTVPDGRIYLGGSIDYMAPASKAEITEHTFIPLASGEVVTLFDNTDGSGVADNTFVTFRSAPVFDLQTTENLVINSSGVNWAIVSGTGSLTGKTYTHVTKVLTKTASGGIADKTVSVTDATLVSIANSENVAQRVMSYYNSARTISAGIVVETEKPGDQIVFNDPYNEPAAAFIAEMSMNASSFIRANCDLITNYVPIGQGNNYTQAIVLTGSGTYTFPAGTETAFVALVGGGSGGASGGRGDDATGSINFGGPLVRGEGGVAGSGGDGGKILAFRLDNPSGSFAYSCGGGGSGAEPLEENASSHGAEGGDTTFGSYTSANGVRSETGYVNLFTGVVYALPGPDGIAGGSGTDGDVPEVIITQDGQTWRSGVMGSGESNEESTGRGGYGGGPAYGANGTDGGDGRVTSTRGLGGDGGHGGTPYEGSLSTTPGCGGGGGHGGGGGGAGGYGSGLVDGPNTRNGSPGSGGMGSKGGNAAPGCIVIYLRGE